MLQMRQTVLLIGDVISLIAAFFIMTAIRFDFSTDGEFIALQTEVFSLLFILWLLVFFVFDLYNLRRVNPNPRNIGLLAIAISVSVVISIILFYLFPFFGITPKVNLAIVALSSFVLLVSWRRFFYNLFASTFIQKVAVVGDDPIVAHLIEDLKKHPHLGQVVSLQEKYVTPDVLEGANLIIANDNSAHRLYTLGKETGSDVYSLSQAYEELFGKIPLSLMSEEKAMYMFTKRNHISARIVGRIIESAIALIVLIVSLPFLLIAALAIWIEDQGPITYSHKRVGKDGKTFDVYKLRSMIRNAEKAGAQWADKKDPRITKVGRVIRALHIDEVPQMVNIIKGDIAMVGPRPERPEYVDNLEREIPYYYLRHTVRPGFTGWAQIKFRYARSIEDSKEKLEYDLFYIKNRNVFLDFGIFVKTLQIIFSHNGR